jgi:hypothetical protein
MKNQPKNPKFRIYREYEPEGKRQKRGVTVQRNNARKEKRGG